MFNIIGLPTTILCVLFLPSSVFAQPNELTKKQNQDDPQFLDYAIQVANWIESQEIVDGQGATWPQSPSLNKSVSYHLYSGTSGVVLFYLQLHRSTGDKKYLDKAKRGATALLEHAKTLNKNSNPAFWTGYTGVAATLAEVYRATDEKNYLDGYRICFELLHSTARKIKDTKRDGVEFNSVTDIIGGSAGIGFFLLYADEIMHEKRALPLAVQVADGLLDGAQPVELKNKTKGLRWMMSPTYPREMPNYSHGTAGICDFLLALDVRLKEKSKTDSNQKYDRRFEKASLAGARYLLSIAEIDNGRLRIIHHRQVKISPSVAVEPLYYLGWCHGPTGTSRLFVHLVNALNEKKEWLGYAMYGANSLVESGIPTKRLPGFWNNVGVCCGSAGVSCHLIDMYRKVGKPKYKELLLKLAWDAIERATKHDLGDGKKGLSWSHAEHRVRPEYVHAQTGIMQGAAGMGLWFLKLDAMLNGQEFELDIPIPPIQDFRSPSQLMDDLEKMKATAKLVATEKAFAKMARDEGVKKAFIHNFAENGIVFQPGPVNARKFWQARPESPALLGWSPVWADISSDEKMGYTTGDWDFRPQGKEDTPIAFGQFITIWKKQLDGKFKAVLDIGVSHAKPKSTANDWQAPEKLKIEDGKIDVAKPALQFVKYAEYEKLFSDDCRLYRDQNLPRIGKQQALKQIKAEQAKIKSAQVKNVKSDGSGDFYYNYGILEWTKNDGLVERSNLLRIWKRRKGQWQIVLEVLTPLPSEKK